jgi:hypothetical protein
VPEDAGVVLDGFNNHVCNRWLTQVERSSSSFVQQSIHGGKCLSRGKRIDGESPVRWQTVVKTPGEENGLICLREMRKTAKGKRDTRMVA